MCGYVWGVYGWVCICVCILCMYVSMCGCLCGCLCVWAMYACVVDVCLCGCVLYSFHLQTHLNCMPNASRFEELCF